MLKQSLMIAAAGLALTACQNRSAEQTAADAANTAANAMESAGEAISNAAARVAPTAAMATPTAPDFVQKAAISDMYEIESSKLAQQKSRSTAVRKFAGEMIAAHDATTASLKTITNGDAALAPPTALDDRHARLVATLRDASPETLDTLYLDQQTAAHNEALALHESYASGGDNLKLKAFAADTAPKVKHHLDMVRQIDHSGVPDDMAGNAGTRP